jgi:dolichyl-phosphate beta-glucosyltransferase
MTGRALIVIPAYNEGERLPSFLEDVGRTLARRDEFDVQIESDGSRSEHVAQMEAAVRETWAREDIAPERLRFRHHARNRGKGGVLRQAFTEGMESGLYDVIGFLDADGSTPFSEGVRLVDRLRSEWDEADAMIGCRLKCLGLTVERKLTRHLVGRVFATLVSTLFGIPVYDSQCGAKFFKTTMLTAERLALCDDERWLFDTQLLIASWLGGVRVRECPVAWREVPGSKVSLVRDPVLMAQGLLTFKRRLAAHGIKVR